MSSEFAIEVRIADVRIRQVLDPELAIVDVIVTIAIQIKRGIVHRTHRHQIEISRVASLSLAKRRQALQSRFQLLWRAHGKLRVGANRVPAIAQPSGAAHGPAALAAYPDGRVGMLRGFRQEIDIGKAAVVAVEGWIVARPEFFERL